MTFTKPGFTHQTLHRTKEVQGMGALRERREEVTRSAIGVLL